MTQGDLFGNDIVGTALFEYPQDSVILFREYHRERPEIYRAFCKYALQMAGSGRSRYGAKGVMERIRWDQAIQYPGDDFKISNSFISMYARVAMVHYPQLDGLFQTKKVRGVKRVIKEEMKDESYYNNLGF